MTIEPRPTQRLGVVTALCHSSFDPPQPAAQTSDEVVDRPWRVSGRVISPRNVCQPVCNTTPSLHQQGGQQTTQLRRAQRGRDITCLADAHPRVPSTRNRDVPPSRAGTPSKPAPGPTVVAPGTRWDGDSKKNSPQSRLLPFPVLSEVLGMKTLEAPRKRAGTSDFADVYSEHFVLIWRFVHSRVRDYHEAQDVTSDVFVRAWRAWPRFDPKRGRVGAWLFTIAYRTVIDWRRTSSLPLADDTLEAELMSNTETPETLVLKEELLAELGWALEQLNERDRDALALRFAGRLTMADIGDVLGVSTAAAKMIVTRALTKLSQAISGDHRDAIRDVAPMQLDAVMHEALSRDHPEISEDRLRQLILHLAVIHQPPVPPELRHRVAWCMECASQTTKKAEQKGTQGSKLGRILARTGLSWGGAQALLGAFLPLCLACTVAAVGKPLLALGLGLSIMVPVHVISLTAVPIIFVLLWRRFRRHGDRLSLSITAIGGLLLLIHLVTHFVAEEGSPVFTFANQTGAALLLGGALLDWRAMYRWMARQKEGFKVPSTSMAQ